MATPRIKKELDFSSSICIRHGVFYDLDYFSESWATPVISSIPLVNFFDQNHKNVLLDLNKKAFCFS